MVEPASDSPSVFEGPAAQTPAPITASEPAFIFEDRTGRRWPRVKGVALALAGLLAAAAVTLLLAVLLVAPGRTQPPAALASTPEQVQSWPNRGAPAQSPPAQSPPANPGP